jgi:hypothetical protein
VVCQPLVRTTRTAQHIDDDHLMIGVEHKPVLLEQQEFIGADGRVYKIRDVQVGEG